MRAAVLEEYEEPLAIRDVERSTADPDGVVAKVDACSVCRSDWHGWVGNWEWFDYKPPLGHSLGHEPSGTVIEVSEDVSDELEAMTEYQTVGNPADSECT